MTLSVTIGGTDVTDRIRLADGYQTITSAADGSYAVAGLQIDDPDSSLVIGRWQQVIIEEDDCSLPRMFTGYVTEARPSRGGFRSGVERIWNIDIGDLNLLLHTQAFHTADAKRPQETGTAKRNWLLGTVPGSYFVNNGNFPDFAGLFDEHDYRKEYADSVLMEFAAIGRIYFLYWDDPDVAIYCAGPTDGIGVSSLSISNLESDLGADVFPPDPTAELVIDMTEVYDEVYLTGPFGDYFLADHDGRLPSGIHRTLVIDTPRVGRASTAAAEAIVLLGRYAGDIEAITCTLRLPSDKVNLIDAGMLVPVKLVHLPGYSADYVNLRVARRTVNIAPVTDGSNLFYDVTLTLTLRGIAVPGGGGTGVFPHQDSCQPGSGDLVQANTAIGGVGAMTVALTSPATEGNLLVMGVTLRQQAFATDPPGWTTLPQGEVDPFENNSKLYYRTAAGGDQTWSWAPTGAGSGDAVAVIAEFAGGVSFVDSDELVSSDPFTGTAPGAAVTPTSGGLSTIVGYYGYKSTAAYPTAGTGWTMTGHQAAGVVYGVMVHKVVSAASGSYTPSISDPVTFDSHSYGEQSAAFSCTATDNPPLPGQWVYGEIVAMADDVGTTKWPYAAGSLIVHVDGVLISHASYTEEDPTGGDFILAWVPNADEVVTVDYQGL